MTPNEFEEQLTELETRVDRLRALYENWFRGYEKTEPRVARKDVERRVYGMRKDLPRNTALRFRYHQLYQRYTTLTTYWTRTAKQIEEGTYRLQVQRFRRKKGERGPEQLEQLGAEGHPERKDEQRERPDHYEIDLDESLNVDDLLSDFEKEAVAKAVDGSIHPPARATFSKPVRPSADEVAASARPSQAQRPSKREPFFDDEHDLPTGLHLSVEDEPPRRASQPKTSQPEAAKLPLRGSLPNGAPVPPPAAGLPKGSLPNGVPAPPPLGARPSLPNGAPVPPPAAGLPRAPLPGAPLPGAPLPGAPLPPAAAKPPPPPPPGAARPSAPEPRPSGPGTGRMPSPFGAPAQPIKPAPVATVGAPAKPTPGPSAPGQARPPIQSVSTMVGRPAPRSPIAGPAPRPAEPPSGDQQLRRIYNEYAEARRKNNEGEVRYEALVSSIQKMMPDLEKKHAGKKIDFEVVVKDGRVGLKPKPTESK